MESILLAFLAYISVMLTFIHLDIRETNLARKQKANTEEKHDDG